MVKTSEEAYIFLININDENELTFRTSRNPQYKQTEKIIIEGDFVYTNLYFFHIDYLNKLKAELNDN